MTVGGFTIRRAEPSDAADAVAMSVSSWRAAHRELLPVHLLNLTDQSREERGIAKWLERGDVDAFVAEEAGQVIGFVMLRPSADEPRGEAEISTFYVATEHWRSGVGSALWEAVLERAKDRYNTGVMLWLLEGNQPAIAFFNSCGFACAGQRTNDKGSPSEQFTEIKLVFDLGAHHRSTAHGI